MAAQGLRDVGDGAETITGAEELTRVKRQAMRVLTYSLIAGALVTAIFLAIP